MGYLPNFCPSCPGGNYMRGLHKKKERKKKIVTLEVSQLGTRNSYRRGCLMVESRYISISESPVNAAYQGIFYCIFIDTTQGKHSVL